MVTERWTIEQQKEDYARWAREEERQEIARSLISNGISLDVIIESTGLSEEAVLKLKHADS
ncbi:MAG: hypothetical protein FWE07_08995 [Turicibacter sp.]|nr:hypothetical protein [Turicibacter sp.]